MSKIKKVGRLELLQVYKYMGEQYFIIKFPTRSSLVLNRVGSTPPPKNVPETIKISINKFLKSSEFSIDVYTNEIIGNTGGEKDIIKGLRNQKKYKLNGDYTTLELLELIFHNDEEAIIKYLKFTGKIKLDNLKDTLTKLVDELNEI